MGTDSRPTREGREGDQPLPVVGWERVVDRLVDRLLARQQLGVQRYGRPLETFNGRDVFRDHEDELLDMHNYAEQIRLEYGALWNAVIALGRRLRGEVVSDDVVGSALLLALRLEEVEKKQRATAERIAEVAAAVEAQRVK